MSGGSYDYAFHKIEDLADEIRADTPLRTAFVEHLRLVAKAARAIEWVDSCDYAKGDEDKPIRACLPEYAELPPMIEQAAKLRDALNASLPVTP